MWTQKIEYVDVEVVLPKPVKKQVWDGEQFVPMTLYRLPGLMGRERYDWMVTNFGPAGTYKAGQYWDHSRAGSFVVMDEKLYMWYQMKWGNK
jgi:hypothetical protein